MTDLPEPLVPAGIDLRDFAFMPLKVQQLRDSNLVSVPDGEVFRANVLSWCVAWHQVPAGSLPDDDPTLARMLGYGRDLKTWRRLRAGGGLRGWVKCSDGRLYHPIVADNVLDAWRRRSTASRKGKVGAQKRWGKNHGSGDGSGDASAIAEPIAEPVPKNGNRQGQGQGQGKDRERTGTKGGGEIQTPSREPSRSDPPATPPSFVGLGQGGLAEAVMRAWNAMAGPAGLSPIQRLTEPRRKAALARLGEIGGLDGIRAAFSRVAASPYLRGERNGPGHEDWRADFDFVMAQKHFTKLAEGGYDDDPDDRAATVRRLRNARGQDAFALLDRALDRAAEGGDRGPVQPHPDA